LVFIPSDGGRLSATTCFTQHGGHHQVVHIKADYIINQLFTSAQHLLPLIIGLHVSTNHSVIFRSLIFCKFQGAVRTFWDPNIVYIKTNPFISVGG